MADAEGLAHEELLSKEILFARRAVSVLSSISPRLGARLTSVLYFLPKRMRSRIERLRPACEVIDLPRPNGKTHRFYAWGRGPTVLFIHGWGGCGSQCRWLIEPIVGSGMRLVTFDAPAHGANPQSTTDSFEITALVEEFVRANAVTAIVAHSFGGVVALKAIKEGVRVDSLVLIAPPNPDLVLGKFASLLQLSEEAVAHHRHFVRRRFKSAGFDPWEESSLARLAASAAGSLVIHDTDDEEVPLDEGRKVVEALRPARHLVTSGYGHHGILAASEALQAATDFVISRAPPRATPPAEEGASATPHEAAPYI